MSSLDKCYGTLPPDGSVPNDLIEEIGHISDAQTCQRFCNDLYNGTCQWFMYDKTTNDCKLFSSSLNNLWNDCREVGYAREPDHELCDEMFPYDSSNGCYNFREDYCRFEFSLLENLEEIDSLFDCRLACQYINNCSYFVYDSPSKICKLNTQLSQKTCDIIHGTPQPNLDTCISSGKIDWASNSTSTPTERSNSTIATTERPETTSSQTTTLPATTPTTQALDCQEDFPSKAAMESNGWSFNWDDNYVFRPSDNRANDLYCRDVPSESYCGFEWSGDGVISYTFNATGNGTLSYGQSWDSGVVSVKMNYKRIDYRNSRGNSVINFSYTTGDTLKLEEEPASVINIHSLCTTVGQ